MDWGPTRRRLYSILYVGELASASWRRRVGPSASWLDTIFICTGNYQDCLLESLLQLLWMDCFTLLYGVFFHPSFVTLHFTGCCSWHHTLPGIALKWVWLMVKSTFILQETSFYGFGECFISWGQNNTFDPYIEITSASIEMFYRSLVNSLF